MWSLEDFELGRKLGTGSIGSARLARERGTGAVVVLKAMRKRRVQRLRVQRHVAREIDIQAHLQHPNVLQLHAFFWDASRIYMVLEFARGGDLGHVLRRQQSGCFEEAVVALCLMQVLRAVAYLHSLHVIHRDLNPRNLFVGCGMRLKLADFGWAVHTRPNDRRWTLCGTLDYIPPEMVDARSGHSFGVDIWAAGILAFELLAGRPPFASPSHEGTYKLILSPEASLAYPAALSAKPRDFVARLLRREPSERLLVAEAAEHAWLEGTEGIELFERATAVLGGA